jgi:NAD(P)-dependent dehydrogenase (short-subunit alcohol dehydrogenase family)
VVVGGTGVLGYAIAEALAAAGAGVAILGPDRERGERGAGLIAGRRGVAKFYESEATDTVSLVAAHRSIRDQLGAPTVLVNAAGGNDPAVTVTPEHRFESILPADWRSSFDLNLMGAALLPCQEFAPGMLVRGKGSIINVIAMSAHWPASGAVAYAAAKAAVLSLTRFLAREWAPNGVRVNSLTSGFFAGEPSLTPPIPDEKSLIARTPMGRLGDPAELAGAAIFLASSRASSYVTGMDLRVDGGFLSQPF